MREPFDKEEALKKIETAVADEMFAGEPWVRNNVRILLAGLYVGLDADNIAKFLGLNRDKYVRPRVRTLRQEGIFGADGKIHANWFEDYGMIDLLFCAMAAEGLVTRHEPLPDAGSVEVVDQLKKPDPKNLPVDSGTDDRGLVPIPSPLVGNDDDLLRKRDLR